MREVSPAVFVCRTCQDDASRAGLHVTLLTRLDLARAVLDGDERRKHHAARLWADLVQVRDLDRLHAAGVIA